MSPGRTRLIAIAASVCLLQAGRAAVASPCEPRVVVAGDGAVAAALRSELAARVHARDTHHDGCEALTVTAAQTERGISLTVQTPGGTPIVRIVPNVNAAATMIETWTRAEFDAPLLATRAVPALAAPAVDTAALDGEAPPGMPRVETGAMPPRTRRVALTAGTSAAIATDGSLWGGLHAGACVALGSLCVGAMGQWLTDTEITGDSEHYETRRSSFDMLVTAESSIAIGRATIVPAAGVGLGTTRIERRGSGAGTADRVVQDERGGPRLAAYIDAAYPVAGRLSLALGISVTLAPSARSESFVDEGIEVAGEPRSYFVAQCGLRYGAL